MSEGPHAGESATKTRVQRAGLLLGLLLFAATLLVDVGTGRPNVTRMAAVAVLMAVWCITEAIPISATALLPLVLYPLLGIQSGRATSPDVARSPRLPRRRRLRRLLAVHHPRWRHAVLPVRAPPEAPRRPYHPPQGDE